MKLKYLLSCSVLCASFVLGGCTPASSNLTPVTLVLDWTPNTNHTGAFVALKKGYFEKEGLKVEILDAPESGAAALLAARRADFIYSYQEEVLQQRASEVPLVAVAAVIAHNSSGFAARSIQKVQSPKDLEGKRYGGWGSPLEEAILRTLIEADGGDPKSVEILNLGSLDFFGATEKLVDFAWIFEGWTGIEAQLRSIDLNYMALKDLDPRLDYYTPVIASHEQFLMEKPQVVRAFLKALSFGYRDAIEKPEEAGAILLGYAPELDSDLVMASQKFLASRYQDDSLRWGDISPKRWLGFRDWMQERNLLQVEGLSGEAFDTRFLP